MCIEQYNICLEKVNYLFFLLLKSGYIECKSTSNLIFTSLNTLHSQMILLKRTEEGKITITSILSHKH